tara:strand:- start:1457 stop:3529 length:2073 start_codon:yes stop_codon:yes gene_type:complete
MPDFLLEVFSEEVPAALQEKGVNQLEKFLINELNQKSLSHSRVLTMSTPRRLVVIIKDIDSIQKDTVEERKGPSINSSKKSIDGFLKSVNLSFEDVEKRETSKGIFLFAKITRKGEYTTKILSEIIPIALGKISWPKSMRWGENQIRWIRPIKSILCLFDDKKIEFRFGHIVSNNITYGHKFHSPGLIEVDNSKGYLKSLHSAKVMLDVKDRIKVIEEKSKNLALNNGLDIVEDVNLIKENACLVEWPEVFLGAIDKDLMNLPEEILYSSIKIHQRYIALKEKDGTLAPFFIIVSNTIPKDHGKSIIAGNQRVLRARLSDALFFYSRDCEKKIEENAKLLSNVVFQSQLGMMDKKVDRLADLSESIIKYFDVSLIDEAKQAAKLCKADLVTEIVSEFPNLQGIMGSYYAKKDGFSENIVLAIRQHYSPSGPNDQCPKEPVSIAIALADKLDTLVGFWIINKKPTSSSDPYGLRRSALGIVRIILENEIDLSINELLERSVNLYVSQGLHADSDKIVESARNFIFDRLKIFIKSQGISHDLITASLKIEFDDKLLRFLNRIISLKSFLSQDIGIDLLKAYRRANNIVSIELKKNSFVNKGEPSKDLFLLNEEHELNDCLQEINGEILVRVKSGEFSEAMENLSLLSKPIDNFFESVKVNTEDATLRENRLKLLSKITATFNMVADFSQIES